MWEGFIIVMKGCIEIIEKIKKCSLSKKDRIKVVFIFVVYFDIIAKSASKGKNNPST